MTKTEFLFYLRGASFQALKYVENNVKTELKVNFRYNIIFRKYAHYSEFDIKQKVSEKMKLDLNDEEVTDLLFKNGKVPSKIEISVLKSSKQTTTFNLLCAEQYVEVPKLFYFNSKSSDNST